MSPALVGAMLARARLTQRLFALAFSMLTVALLFDLVDVATGTGALGLPAYWLTAAGIGVGLGAGLCRLGGPPPSRSGWAPWPLTRQPGFFRAAALALFAASWSLRGLEGDMTLAALTMALLGVGFAIAAPWLAGAELEPSDPQQDADRPLATPGQLFEQAGATPEEPAASAF